MFGSSSTNNTVAMFVPPVGCCRQLDDEARKAAFVAVHSDPAAEVLNDAEAQAQPQPCAAAVAPAREEGVKHFLDHLAADADAVVVEFQADHLLAGALLVTGRDEKPFRGGIFAAKRVV